MPFQSEKQRKYLWANEPEIARDWTDKYGSGIAKALGGRIPFQEGGFKNWLGDATGYTQHNINNQLLRNAMASNQINEEQYKRMGGYDVAQNMPNFMQNKTLPVGLASLGYQGAKTVAGWINPDDPNAQYGDVGRLGSIGLNMEGAQGLSPNDLALYHNIMTPRSAFQDDYNYTPQETMTANWSQFDDAEAQASGMFKEEDENGNWFNTARRWGAPIYNAYKGNIGRAAIGALGGLPGMALGAFFGGKNLRNSAAYRPATGSAGGYSASQLNSMNALGGYYSEPARDARRTQSRIDNMMARKAAGKSYSQKNLNTLTMNQGPAGQNGGNQGNNKSSSGSSSQSNSPGHPSNRARGGRMAQGGLASLWQR